MKNINVTFKAQYNEETGVITLLERTNELSSISNADLLNELLKRSVRISSLENPKAMQYMLHLKLNNKHIFITEGC